MKMDRFIRAGAVLLTFSALSGCKTEQASTETKKAAVSPQASGDAIVYAASAHVRVLDANSRTVLARIDLQKGVRQVLFAPDGNQVYVAASDGVRQIDAINHAVIRKLSVDPARAIAISNDGRRLQVLSHRVIVSESGARDIHPFRLSIIDTESGKELSSEEIGQRILFANAGDARRGPIVVSEMGELRLGTPGTKMADAKAVDLRETVTSKVRPRLRKGTLVANDFAYVPLEADPSAILKIDLRSQQVSILSLSEMLAIRGLAHDKGRLYVNVGNALLVVDAASGARLARIGLEGAHADVSLGSEGRFAYLAQTVDGTGGAITTVDLEKGTVVSKTHLDDISPWALAVRP